MININRGKKLLVSAIIVNLLISFASTAILSTLYHQTGNTDEAVYTLTQGMFRFILECLLFFLVYKGYRWARIVALILFGAASALSLAYMLDAGALQLTLLIPCAYAFIVMLNKSVKAFLTFKRTGENPNIDIGE